MASKKAILMAYEVISANAPLIKAENDHSYRILIHSWDMALNDIDDKTLAAGVERFLREVTEVNRSMVISAKLRELCQPKRIPFNEYIVPQTINKMIQVCRDINELKKVKAETDPILWELIQDYPFDAIRVCSMEQLPTIYAQIRNDYKLRYMSLQVKNHNAILEQLQRKEENNLLTEYQKCKKATQIQTKITRLG